MARGKLGCAGMNVMQPILRPINYLSCKRRESGTGNVFISGTHAAHTFSKCIRRRSAFVQRVPSSALPIVGFVVMILCSIFFTVSSSERERQRLWPDEAQFKGQAVFAPAIPPWGRPVLCSNNYNSRQRSTMESLSIGVVGTSIIALCPSLVQSLITAAQSTEKSMQLGLDCVNCIIALLAHAAFFSLLFSRSCIVYCMAGPGTHVRVEAPLHYIYWAAMSCALDNAMLSITSSNDAVNLNRKLMESACSIWLGSALACVGGFFPALSPLSLTGIVLSIIVFSRATYLKAAVVSSSVQWGKERAGLQRAVHVGAVFGSLGALIVCLGWGVLHAGLLDTDTSALTTCVGESLTLISAAFVIHSGREMRSIDIINTQADEERERAVVAMERETFLTDRATATRGVMRYLFHELRVPLNSIVLGLSDTYEVIGEVLERLKSKALSQGTANASVVTSSSILSCQCRVLKHRAESVTPVHDPLKDDVLHSSIPGVPSAQDAPFVGTHWATFRMRASADVGDVESSVGAFQSFSRNPHVCACNSCFLESGRAVLLSCRSSALGLGSLLDDFLSLDKIEQGDMRLECEPFNIRDWAAQCLDMLRPACLAKHIDVACTVDDQVPAEIAGDAYKLRQCLCNLLSNAIKFSPEGGSVAITCTIVESLEFEDIDIGRGTQSAKGRESAGTNSSSTATTRSGSWLVEGSFPLFLRVAVADGGVGIAEEEIHKLFLPFQQIRAGALQKGNGTGLGLAIVKQLITLSGGTVGVRSRVGEGSTFYMQVPLCVRKGKRQGIRPAMGPATPWRASTVSVLPDPLALGASMARGVPPSRTTTDITNISRNGSTTNLLPGLRLGPVVPLTCAVVVDDVASNRMFLSRLMTRRGVVVTEASDGMEAVELAERLQAEGKLHGVQAWLIDEEMPGMNGTEAIRRIRGMGVTAVMISVTGNALDGDRRLMLEAGADAVCTKPLRLDQLESQLNRAGLCFPLATTQHMEAPVQTSASSDHQGR